MTVVIVDGVYAAGERCRAERGPGAELAVDLVQEDVDLVDLRLVGHLEPGGLGGDHGRRMRLDIDGKTLGGRGLADPVVARRQDDLAGGTRGVAGQLADLVRTGSIRIDPVGCTLERVGVELAREARVGARLVQGEHAARGDAHSHGLRDIVGLVEEGAAGPDALAGGSGCGDCPFARRVGHIGDGGIAGMGRAGRPLGDPDGDLGGHIGLVTLGPEEVPRESRAAGTVIEQVVELG